MDRKIVFSRHAIRRIQLYQIDAEDVEETVKLIVSAGELGLGRHEVVNRKLSMKYRYPLKIVVNLENEKIIVVTAYPVRKECRR